jgi:hypothetical protein
MREEMCLTQSAADAVLAECLVDADKIFCDRGSIGGSVDFAELGFAEPSAGSEMADKRRRWKMPDFAFVRQIGIAARLLSVKRPWRLVARRYKLYSASLSAGVAPQTAQLPSIFCR